MRNSLGIEDIDRYIYGFNVVSSNLLIGPPGCGKTILGLQYLADGAKKGERVLYISLDQPAIEVKEDFSDLDIYLIDIYVFDAVPSSKRKERRPYREVTLFADVSTFGNVTALKKTMAVDILALRETLKNIFERKHYDRIVVDSLSALQVFYMHGLDAEIGVHSFIQFMQRVSNSAILFLMNDMFETKYIEKYMDTVLKMVPVRGKNHVILEIVKYDYFTKVMKLALTLTNVGFVLKTHKKGERDKL